MEQFNITESAKMFDAVLASDNISVQKALRNFMMIAAIVHAAGDNSEERLMGPLETLVKKVADLERIVVDMKNNRNVQDRTSDYYKNYYGNSPSWVYNPDTGTPYSGSYPSTNITSSSTTWKDELGYTAQEVSELMKELKFK